MLSLYVHMLQHVLHIPKYAPVMLQLVSCAIRRNCIIIVNIIIVIIIIIIIIVIVIAAGIVIVQQTPTIERELCQVGGVWPAALVPCSCFLRAAFVSLVCVKTLSPNVTTMDQKYHSVTRVRNSLPEKSQMS